MPAVFLRSGHAFRADRPAGHAAGASLLFPARAAPLPLEPGADDRPRAAGPQFDIELAPDEFAMPKAPKSRPRRSSSSRPILNAPDNVPDKTSNFGAQNQQAAQEKPSRRSVPTGPRWKESKDFESTRSSAASSPAHAAVPERASGRGSRRTVATRQRRKRSKTRCPVLKRAKGDDRGQLRQQHRQVRGEREGRCRRRSRAWRTPR
jgi:hypothetical protein